MGITTGISWTDATWNAWQGCKKVSTGCKNCYMFRDKERFGQNPNIVIRSARQTFYAPTRWSRKKELPTDSKIFVCSWSDFFIEEADEWRDEAWEIIKYLPEYKFQILTKRPERMSSHLPADWGTGYSNVWLGVSVENQVEAEKRLPYLAEVPAAIKWISAEPLLGALQLTQFIGHTLHQGISWVVVGGESGNAARHLELAWAADIRNQCREANVAFYMKQLSEFDYPKTFRDFKKFPRQLQIREFPTADDDE